MASYGGLNGVVAASGGNFESAVTDCLVGIWLDDYARLHSTQDIIETRASGFSYLFDMGAERLVAAWGVSQGRSDAQRDKGRMARHPNSYGNRYHRGHAIPHTLGGVTDINLVPQLGKINTGDFRKLEIEAVATPGACYFSYWMYSAASSQRPTSVDQGLIVPGRTPVIRTHMN